MNKHKLLLLLAWVLVVNAYGQTQLKNWYHFSKKLNFQAIPIISSTNLAGTQYHASNVMSDINGEIAFYCKIEGGTGYSTQKLEIYNRYNKITPIDVEKVEGWIGWNQTEIPIVPLIENNKCFKRFYVFYRSFNDTLNRTVVYAKIVSCNIANNLITVSDVMNGSKKRIILFGAFHYDIKMGGLAASKLNQLNTRYLYFVDGEINRISINEYNTNNDGLGDQQLIVNSTQHLGVNYQTLEVDISPDGSKLAWPEYNDNGMFRCIYHIFNINILTGDLTFYKTLTIPNINSFEPRGRRCGLEFGDNGNVLYVTSGRYQSNDINEGIYMFGGSNFSTSTYIGQPNCAWSQLERGFNGRIYASDNNSFFAVNQNTNTLEPAYNLINVVSQRSLYNLMNDQIDGENYDPYLPNFMFFDNPRDLITGGYIPIIIPYGTSVVWNPAYFGGKSIVKFTDVIRVQSPWPGYTLNTKLSIENLTVELYDNVTLNVGTNANLDIKNSILQGISNPQCGTGMWDGVFARSLDPIWPAIVNVNPLNSNIEKCTIKDAVVGINLYGPYSKLRTRKNTFTANNIDIKLESVAQSSLSCSYNNFIDNVPLKNQTGDNIGSNLGYDDDLKRTQIGIAVLNATALVGIGEINTFKGGQIGVLDINSMVTVNLNTFNGQKQNAVSIKNFRGTTNNRKITVSQNIIENTFNGISVDNVKNADINLSANNLNNIENYGIDYFNNNESKLLIGGVPAILPNSNAANSNLFYNCGNAAINLHNNSHWFRTDIEISQLRIVSPNLITSSNNNQLRSNMGIVITESSGGTQKYKSFKIYNNSTTNLNYGIWLTNVVGANPSDPKERDVSTYQTAEITSNTININTSKAYHTGISLNGSVGLNTLFNTLKPITTANRYNTSISSSNSFNSLIFGNYTKTGKGFVPQGNMINSNYYCNTFDRAYTGIQLKNHILRQLPSPNGTFYTHGVVPTESRNNIFANRPASGADIDVAGSNVNNNKWIFNGIPKIVNSILPAATNISAGTGLNLCSNLPEPHDPQPLPPFEPIVLEKTPINNFWSEYYQQQQFNMGYAPIGASDNNIVRLVNAEDTIALGENYVAALAFINLIQPDSGNAILNDYKTVYQTYLNYKLLAQEDRSMSQADVNILHTIALKNPVTQSPSAHTARAILWHERQLFYIDSEEVILQLAGYLDATCGANIAGISVFLERADNQIMQTTAITDSLGQFIFTSEAIAPYFQDTNTYRMFLMASNGNTLYSPYASMKQLAAMSDYVFTCTQLFGKNGNIIEQLEKAKVEMNAIDKLPLILPITITPNPATDNITIHNAPNNAVVSIQNILGATIYKGNANLSTIDVSSFAKGVYIVNIHTNASNHVQKINIR